MIKNQLGSKMQGLLQPNGKLTKSVADKCVCVFFFLCRKEKRLWIAFVKREREREACALTYLYRAAARLLQSRGPKVENNKEINYVY